MGDESEYVFSDMEIVDELALIALGERNGDEDRVASLRYAILERLGHEPAMYWDEEAADD